jgi:hypothetical protein
MISRQDRRARTKDAGEQTATCADFVGVELARGCSLERNRYLELEIKKTKPNGANTIAAARAMLVAVLSHSVDQSGLEAD